MIQITDKTLCCGCNACGDICPYNAISYRADEEGFWYPVVDESLCINCNLCEKVCPVIHKNEKIIRYTEPIVYAAYSKNKAIRIDSTSGGIHSELSLTMYEKKSYVSGAIYNSDHTVSHIIDNNPKRLEEIRSSKYVQSNASGIYKQIKDLLKADKKVFFCGCPCQVQALYNFLSKDYENLVTCDFICRGVNSPKVFLKYIEMLEKQYGAKASKIKFKAKKWGWHNFSMRVNFTNGKQYCKDRYHDLFFIGYLQSGNFARPSCYQCHFKGFPQKSDITLADFWGIERLDKSMDQDLGTSLVMINSDKGKKLFDSIKERIIYKQFSMQEARTGNPAMDTSLRAAANNRELFFNELDKMPFKEISKKYFPSPKQKLSLKKSLHTQIEKLKLFKHALGTLHRIGISKINFITVFTCFCSKQIKSPNRLFYYNYGNSILQINQNATLFLNAFLKVGMKQVKHSNEETRILLEENSEMYVNGDFTVYSGSYIRIFPYSRLIINGGFINEKVQISCGDTIEIGSGCAIGRDVVIRSHDGHTIDKKGYKIAKPIKIGEHVWIGQGATILKGVTIGNNAIVASGSIVTKDVPANSMVAGVPAKVIYTNVSWH